MELRPSLTVWGKRIEIFLAGYHTEHFVLALQLTLVLIVAMVPVFVNNAYRALDQTSSFWIPVTAVTVLEPCTGNVLRKYLIRILAIAVALGMGTLVLLVAFDACDTSPMDLPSNQALFAHMVCLGTTICAALIMLHRQRWASDYEYAFFLAQLSLLIIVVPSVREGRADALENAAWRALCIAVGVTISSVVAFTVFPIKARHLLQKQTAAVLLQMGDLAAWVMSEVADARPGARWGDEVADFPDASDGVFSAVGTGKAPASPGTDPEACKGCHAPRDGLPGATGADRRLRYLDDGLAARLAPLSSQSQDLAVHLARLDELLRSARAEFNVFTRPHWFPGDTYAAVLMSMHLSISLLQSQLYLMATGTFSTAATRDAAPDIREAGLQLSVVFTLLSRMSYTRRTPLALLKRALRRGRRVLTCAWCRGGAARASDSGDGSATASAACPAPGAALQSLAGAPAAALRAGPRPRERQAAALGWLDSTAISEVMRAPEAAAGRARSASSSSSASGEPPAPERALPGSRSWDALAAVGRRPEALDDPFADLVRADEDGDREAGSHPPPVIRMASRDIRSVQRAVAEGALNEEGAHEQAAPRASGDASPDDKSAGTAGELRGPAAKLYKLHELCERLLAAGTASCGRPGVASLTQTAFCLMGLSRQAACVLGALDPETAAALHDRISDLGR